ncbi:hypothetical protein CEXT_346151 [Caerostris extrusa]|uniref:Uncharacterized protein n=1 Tax=Caerostris extrusa TaxID=172846 RepID=A0AAV4WEG0_CAEEX|nr:hypothetical protein CEXT_346151 [Caerostris extrusa]
METYPLNITALLENEKCIQSEQNIQFLFHEIIHRVIKLAKILFGEQSLSKGIRDRTIALSWKDTKPFIILTRAVHRDKRKCLSADWSFVLWKYEDGQHPVRLNVTRC